jgi:hypothetical protein
MLTIVLYTDGGRAGNNKLDIFRRMMGAVVSDADGTALVHLTKTRRE